MRITMLMPKLPPAVCGIADHSLLLGKALRELGADVKYMAPHGEADDSSKGDKHLWDGTADGLLAATRRNTADVLWIQYSGYGFSRKGIPVGLARAAEHVARCRPCPSVVTCMHETHASRSGLGWRTPIIQPLQISVARRIVRAADVVFATVEINLQRCIREYGASRDAVRLLPIAANVPDICVSVAERAAFRERLGLAKGARVAAIFGLWSTQIRTLALFGAELQSALRRGEIEHVVAVGGETTIAPNNAVVDDSKAFKGRMSVLGPASAADIARVLRCCDIGLVPTAPDYFRKSGVAAAFTAAGLRVWMKDHRGNTLVQDDIEAFPSWSKIAALALETMNSRFKSSHHATG